jgi:hypothetical protein
MSVDRASTNKKFNMKINNNPRYAASRASSIVGCMMGSLKKPLHPAKAQIEKTINEMDFMN